MVSYDPKRTDKVVAEQQAANMRLAQLEERREEAQRQAGWEGLTFRQILERTDGAEKDTLTGLFERFENAVNEIRFYNSRSLSFANDGLRILGAAGVDSRPALMMQPDASVMASRAHRCLKLKYDGGVELVKTNFSGI